MEILLLYFLLGVIAGFVGGLFGLGGGVVIVPLLILSFTAQGFSSDVLTHMAIGTSLATIVVTSVSAAWVHHKRESVLWHTFFRLAPGICVGAVLGGLVAAKLSGQLLQLVFGFLMMAVSVQVSVGIKPGPHRELPGAAGLASAGSVFGLCSALFGIGGGSLTTPYLLWCNVPVHKAIATSAVCGLPIGLFAAITYGLSGAAKELPDYSLGFIYLPALFGIMLATIVSVRWGAALAHRIPARQLRRLFAAVLFLLGGRFVVINLVMLAGA